MTKTTALEGDWGGGIGGIISIPGYNSYIRKLYPESRQSANARRRRQSDAPAKAARSIAGEDSWACARASASIVK